MKKVKINTEFIFIFSSHLQPVVSVLSLEGSIAAGKSKGSLSLEQCRKRVEKAFESEKLTAVLLRWAITSFKIKIKEDVLISGSTHQVVLQFR